MIFLHNQRYVKNHIINVNDLNIKADILEIFDNTLNAFSRDGLLDILLTPLQNIDEINNRQQVIEQSNM